MTMKFWKHLAFVSCAVALSGCSTSDDLFDGTEEAYLQESNAIRFDTYLGGNIRTRSGYQGAVNTDVLKASAKANGFGVFAYYTGAQTYQEKNGTGTNGISGSLAPNFMYNEHIVWNDGTTSWAYSDASATKYWPNEVQNGAVDDQDGDTGSNPATSSGANGGNLSFFAYAPWTDVTASSGSVADASEGIAGFKDNNDHGDPVLTYKIPADGETVDLLWGTYNGTSENVVGQPNSGVVSTASHVAPAYVKTDPIADRTTYAGDILEGYRTNADLTKQKTTGRVGFAFKHALAKLGGSTTDPGGTGTKNGLLIVLDIDNNGAETGGTKPNNTIVTVESIVIKTNPVKVDTDHDGSFDDETAHYYTGGKFNLATGKWGDLTYTDDASGAVTHTISTTAATPPALNPVLNHVIAEPDHTGEKAALTYTDPKWSTTVDKTNYVYDDGSKVGVQTTIQNVYENDPYPLVFIPGTVPSLQFTITYYVRTYDSKLDKDVASDGEGTWSKVKQVISKNITFDKPVELNKQYNLLIHLGLTSVKFTATVSDWDVVTEDPNLDIDDNGTMDLHVEDVYTPINVGEAKASYTWNSTAESLVVAAGTTTVNVTLTGMSDGSYTPSITSGTGTISPSVATALSGGTSDQTLTVTLSMDPNSGTTDVTNTIQVTDGSTTKIITITQKASPLSVKATTTTFAAAASSDQDPNYTITTLIGNNAVTSPTFIVTGTGFTQNGSAGHIDLTANTSYSKRTGTVNVTKGNSSGSIVLTQSAAEISVSGVALNNVVTLTVQNVTDSNSNIDLTTNTPTLVVLDADNSDAIVNKSNYNFDASEKTVTFSNTGTHNYKFKVSINDSEATSAAVSSIVVP